MSQARRDVSFAAVLQKMLEDKRTGILDVSGPDGEWEIHLHQGGVIHARQSHGGQWTLGEALVSRGIMSASRLHRLDAWARKRGLEVEDVLVSRGEVSQELVERIQTMHLREIVLPLFRKVGIYCHFRHEAPGFLAGARKVGIAELLKEGGRRLKLWSVIEKRIASLQSVYRRVEGGIPHAFGDLGADASVRNAQTREGLKAGVERLNANQKLVFFELNGKKTVRQLSIATGLGDFETSNALLSLLDFGLIRLVELEGMGEKPLEISYLPAVANGLATSLLVAMFAWIAFSWSPDILLESNKVHQVPLTPSLQVYREGMIRHGLVRSAVDAGYFPSRLEDLQLEGWLAEVDLGPFSNGTEWNYVVSRLRDRYSLFVTSVGARPMHIQDEAEDSAEEEQGEEAIE